MLWLDQCLQTWSCNNPDVWRDYLVIYSTKRTKKNPKQALVCFKHDSSGFLIQCDANGHVSYAKKSSKSNSNFSINRMQRSIFSNTVYKNSTSLARLGLPGPSVKQRQASCIFKTQTFQSILTVQKTAACWFNYGTHQGEGTNVSLSTRRPQCWVLLYIAFPISKWQLPHAVLFNFVLQMWERCPI